MTDQIPAAAITAAISAYNKSYLTSNSSNPRFVEKVVTAVLEAAAPLIAAQATATERRHIRGLMDEHHENADCDITWLADLLDGDDDA